MNNLNSIMIWGKNINKNNNKIFSIKTINNKRNLFDI